MSAACGACGKVLERRAHVVYVGNLQAKFYYPCGHTATLPVIKKKKGLPAPSEAAARMMAKWWDCANGGVHASCARCARARTTTQPRKRKTP